MEVNDYILLDYFKKQVDSEQISYLKTLHGLSKLDKYYNEGLNAISELVDINNNTDITFEDRIKKKTQIIKQKLWGWLLRAALLFLREKDPFDLGKYREDFGISQITDYFKSFQEFEELLFGSDKSYRDHSLHVFKVFLLGTFLMKEFHLGFEQLIIQDWDKIGTDFKAKISHDEKEAMWCVCSLTHDLGYPIEKLNKINKKVKEILSYYGSTNVQEFSYNIPLQNQFFNDFILKFISSKITFNEETKPKDTKSPTVLPQKVLEGKSSNLPEPKKVEREFHLKIQTKYYAKFLTSFEKFCHGVTSCILLMKNIVYFLESDYLIEERYALDENEARQFVIRREILRAIAAHDCQDIYHFNFPTLSLLLILSDELQDWERSREKEDDKNSVEITAFNSDHIEFCKKFEISDDKEHLKIIQEKFRNFVRIFRSAVDSTKREFFFKATYIISSKKYELIYPPKDAAPEFKFQNKLANIFDFFMCEKLDEIQKII